MKRDLEFTFRTSISREGYKDKDTAKQCLSSHTAKKIGKAKMAFKEQTVSVQEFIDYAVKGYAFCNLFKFDENKRYWIKSGKAHYTQTYPVYRKGVNKGYFKLSFKSDEFFAGSQTVFVDIDFTHFDSLTDYISCLTYQPTCAYYSYSDGADKGGVVSRRFRLVYIFDSVLSMDDFRNVTFTLYDSIVRDTQEEMYDMCGCSYSQYMNGSNSTDTYQSNIIYSVADFPVYQVNYQVEEEKPVEQPEKGNKPTFTEELLNDITYAPYELVVRKWYAKGLRYITRSEVDFGDNFYVTTTDDFVQLNYLVEKVTDGNQRRKKLYIRAALRRLMKEDITHDELLYNLYIDRYKFFDNTDEVLTVDVLITKVKAAMLTSMDKIREMAEGLNKPTFVISSTVEDKHAAVAKARREITDSTIGSMFDTTASIQANYTTIKEAGYTISVSRLYKFCKDNHIKPVKSGKRTSKPVVTGYNPTLSVRENMKQMNCTMYAVLKAKKAYSSAIQVA